MVEAESTTSKIRAPVALASPQTVSRAEAVEVPSAVKPLATLSEVYVSARVVLEFPRMARAPPMRAFWLTFRPVVMLALSANRPPVEMSVARRLPISAVGVVRPPRSKISRSSLVSRVTT